MKRETLIRYAALAIMAPAWMALASPAMAKNPQERQVLGSGTVVEVTDCDPEVSDDCTVLSTTTTVEGEARVQGGGSGNFSAQVTANWEAAMENGSEGGLCAPASGAILVSTKNGRSSFTASMAGLLCQVPESLDAEIVPSTFNGSFDLTSTEGKFSGWSGTGRVTLSEDGTGEDADALLHMNGVFGR